MKLLQLITPILLTTSLLSSNIDVKDRIKSLGKFAKVTSIIEKYYVDDINLSSIVNKALDGLLSNLDAHSSYLTKKKLNELQIQTKGEFGGLGITVGLRKKVLTVISPIDDTPAFKAGLKSEDIILKIDNKSTLGMSLDKAVSIMRGKPKTSIHLTIVRKGENKPLKIKIIRDIIKINSVYTKIIEDEKMLYIRVSTFDNKVTKKVKKAIIKNPKINGIVLDLRNNPGGLLNQAIGLTDLFVSNGVIVSQKGKDNNDEKKHYANEKNTFSKVPLVVLINAGSASASEIVSGALQDHKRAILIGKKTFGKGSVQAIVPVSSTEALRITIAKYYLPSGRTIQALGVTPDILIDAGKVPISKEDEFSMKEKDLARHLKNELEIDSKIVKNEKVSLLKDKNIFYKKDILNDIQLKTAIDTINVIKILNNNK